MISLYWKFVLIIKGVSIHQIKEIVFDQLFNSNLHREEV